MNRVSALIMKVARYRLTRWAGAPLLAVTTLGAVISQVTAPTPPSIPTISLASEPLYARGVRAKPTLTLALSVEFPTVGQAYPASDNYDTTKEYVGYFDAASCYTYSDVNKRFDRSGDATNRTCGGAGFSGNFMNWATTSAIDILRYSLTGGDRITDTASKTVLQRAVIPTNFYNGSNFTSKSIGGTLAAGALPSAVLSGHSGAVYIANCLDRVYFGTASGGSCGNAGTNGNLGTSTSTSTAVAAPRPTTGFTDCAGENGTCTFTGTKQVIYGADVTAGGGTGAYATKTATGSISCNNATFGDPLVGTAKRCYYRDVPAAAGVAVNLTVDPYYTARVSVCDSSSGNLVDPRPKLCQRYPSGNYKPVGNLQKYSERLRVAAFGYLRDNSLGRYGGVLRAPMKYVGPKAYDANFNAIAGTNSAREWDETSGVFIENPNASTEFSVSGVTNYLNRFGRTGATPGVYKTYDPVGELYYEALRYVQGLTPTAGAISELSAGDAKKDGYPVYETWVDPHPPITGLGSTGSYACVKNNILTIGDVNTHADKTIPGNTRTASSDAARTANPAGNEPDFYQWTKVVGGFESNNAVSYAYVKADGAATTQTSSNPNTPNAARWGMENQSLPCCSNNSFYMAGMAYWANTHDIRGSAWTAEPAKQRPGMRARSFFVDVNEFGGQTDVTTRRNNQFYLAAKYGGFTDESDAGNPFLKSDGTTDNTNWQQANGDAKTYFLAGNPVALIDSIDKIFAQVGDRANSIAGGAITTQQLTGSGGNIYQASFDSSDWSGDLISVTLTLNADGTVSLGTSATAPWKAAASLKARVTAGTSPRNIVVGKTTSNAAGAATDFLWNNIGTDHQDALRLPPGGTQGVTPPDAAASGAERLNYIRGDQSLEAPVGSYRKRNSILGDIVNSGVVFKGAPSESISGVGYNTFYTNNKTRTKALYVGANDGMLHAFNADTGDELFAYVPSVVVPNLSALTSQAYTHRAYVDATPTVGEANLGTSDSPNWKTVLVAGVGGGGQGVFALDVTTPSSFTAGSTLWEFTDRDDSDLGNVVGKPQILKIRTSGTGTSAVYKWFAVVASGVNNYIDDGRFSTTGKPALFFLDLSKAPAAAWSQGVNYFKIRFPQSSTTTPTGIIGFAATGGAADEVAQMYAGDLQGNLWKLDFTGITGVANATVVDVSAMLGGTAVNLDASIPLFVATSDTSERQPISMEPTLLFGPNRTTIVAIGTGMFLESADIAGPYKKQSVYAVLDNGTATIPSRGRLNTGTQNATTGDITAGSFTWGIPSADTDVTVRAGWYFDFAGSSTSGERQISNFELFGRSLIFGSVIPAQNGCDEGSGNQYTISQTGGIGTSTLSTVGILGQPIVLQVGSATLTVSDSTGGRMRTRNGRIIQRGSGGLSEVSIPPETDKVGRLSWRQLNNYQEIKGSTP